MLKPATACADVSEDGTRMGCPSRTTMNQMPSQIRADRPAPTNTTASRLWTLAPWVTIAVFVLLGIVDAVAPRSAFSSGIEIAAASLVAFGCFVRALRSRRTTRIVWALFGTGMALNAVGDILYIALGEPTVVSLADAFYLPTYPFLLGAAAVLIVACSGRGSRELLFDAAIVAVVSGLAIWQFLVVNPGVSSEGPLLQRVVFSAYPMCGSLLVADMVGLLLVPGRRRASLGLVTAFAMAFLASDTGYNISAVIESDRILRWSNGGYIVCYGILLAASMHRSADSVCDPARRNDRTTSRSRLALLSVAMVGAPSLAVLTPALGFRFQAPAYATAAGLVSLLAVARIGLLVRDLEYERASLKVVQSELSHQAWHDGLTGLPNRSQLIERLDLEIALSRTLDEQLAILFLDLDQFKVVNDSLGHPIGDRLLVATAERLRSAVRDQDQVARIGGDEFVVMCPRLASPDDAREVAERVLAAMRLPLELDGRTMFAGASLGIAIADGHADAAALIRDADVALYRAKESGRDSYVVFKPIMGSWAVERLELETALRGAIERDELSVVYQPRVHLPGGELQGFEALLRWRHAGRAVPVAQLIELAEITGLIIPIGEWVLRRACEDLAMLEAGRGGTPIGMAVNVSVRQLIHPGFVAQVDALLAGRGIDPSRLTLELTETSLAENPELATSVLEGLRALGVRIEIDDFGKGYSSLVRLSTLPLDGMKVDRRFVSEIGESQSARSVVEAVLALGRALSLEVTAEGVETRQQAEWLTAMGCTLVQGFYFSRPLPLIEAREFGRGVRSAV